MKSALGGRASAPQKSKGLAPFLPTGLVHYCHAAAKAIERFPGLIRDGFIGQACHVNIRKLGKMPNYVKVSNAVALVRRIRQSVNQVQQIE